VRCLNLHESERRKPHNWIPIAWFPIYDVLKSKRPTQGYECDAARQTRLFHDCWRNILKRWKEKTQHARNVVYGDKKCRQTRSGIGGILGDQQVHNQLYMHYLHKSRKFCIIFSGNGSIQWRRLANMPSLPCSEG